MDVERLFVRAASEIVLFAKRKNVYATINRNVKFGRMIEETVRNIS